MDLERSVFSVAEPRRFYAVGMITSFLIHVLLALAILTLPKLLPEKRFSDIKAYHVKMVSAEQLGKLPQLGVKPPSASEILLKPGSRESKEGGRGDIPVYSVRKINVPTEERSVTKAEIRPIESSPSMPAPQPSRRPSAQWENLLPNISIKKDVKPIEQRREFLKEQQGTETSKAETKAQPGGSIEAPKEASSERGSRGGTQQAESGKGQTYNERAGHEGGGTSQVSEEYGLARKLYYSEVWRAIQSQWAVPVELLNRDDLEAIIVIRVRRDGTIMDMRFEKKSGNEIFDSSVWRAVQKANPLPPFPKAYNPPYEEIGVRFRPKDLRKG